MTSEEKKKRLDDLEVRVKDFENKCITEKVEQIIKRNPKLIQRENKKTEDKP